MDELVVLQKMADHFDIPCSESGRRFVITPPESAIELSMLAMMKERGDKVLRDYTSKAGSDIYAVALLIDEYSAFPVCGLEFAIHNTSAWQQQMEQSGITETQAKWLYWKWLHQDYSRDLLSTTHPSDHDLISQWVEAMGYSTDDRESYHNTRNRFWGLAAYYGTTLRHNTNIQEMYRTSMTIILDNNHSWEWPVHAATCQVNPAGQADEWLNISIPDIA